MTRTAQIELPDVDVKSGGKGLWRLTKLQEPGTAAREVAMEISNDTSENDS